MGEFFASIRSASLVSTETQNIPIIMIELPVLSGTLSWQLKMICCSSDDSSQRGHGYDRNPLFYKSPHVALPTDGQYMKIIL